MKKRSAYTLRMLPFVVQAVTDLKDKNGSTTRKILDQVHTAINVTNVKPKPRNVVMQVRKALKHAVDSGVLRHKAGKYKLIIDSKTKPKEATLQIRTQKGRSRRRGRRQRKDRRAKSFRRGRRRRRRNLGLKRYPNRLASGTSVCSTCTCCRSAIAGSYAVVPKKKSRSSRRRHRSLVKKSTQARRATAKTKRRLRQPTPMPMKANNQDVEESPTDVNGRDNLKNVFPNNFMKPDGDNDPNATYLGAKIVEIPPECDNPECLCNLKQEPYDDNNYDSNGMTYQ